MDKAKLNSKIFFIFQGISRGADAVRSKFGREQKRDFGCSDLLNFSENIGG